ncbi:protein translocase subunit SecD, partial [bacterium]|nr:protein translocase subunit SecD [bacterium]
RPAVGFDWNSTGKTKFYEMTSNNVGRQMAIVLDGVAQSAPVIKSAIGESGIIEGGASGFSEDEVKRLIVILKAGALPAKPVFQYEQKVGATLGQAALLVGGIATLASMVLVLGFMVFYYKAGGLIANIALALNILLLLGSLAMFGATLTLPGIAGILLTAGMAVDANILIFERMREEKARGAELKQAIELAYDRAFWTIFDSHVTTLVTGFVLYWTGTGPIRGFAVTLIIGIAISLFTSLFVTKAVYGWLGDNGKLPQINFLHIIKNSSFDFMGFYPKAVTGSLILINVGFVVFLFRGQEKYGIDFTGGTVLEMRLKKPLEKKEVDDRVQSIGIKDFDSQRVGAQVPGGIDRGTGFVIITRKLGEQLGGAKKVSDLGLPSLLREARGQGSQIGPAGGNPPNPPAPVGSPGQGNPPADVNTSGATIGPPTPPAGEITPPAGEVSASQLEDQSKFREAVTRLFEKELVEPFPETPGHVATGPYKIELTPDGRATLTFRVNMVPIGTGSGELNEETLHAAALQSLATYGNAPIPSKNVNPEETARRDLAREIKELTVKLDPAQAAEGSVKTFVVTSPAGANQADVAKRTFDVVRTALEKNGKFTVADPFPRVDQIGGAVAKNLKVKAYISMFFAMLAIVLYVAFRFEFIWGIGAILSLVHDLFTTMGFMAICDSIFSFFKINFDAKINLPTVAAFLTLLGYSIADTIVVYDRIRERVRLAKQKHADAKTVNEAINGTLSRTILTSLTVFLVALVLFVCSFQDLKVIQGFSVAMCFGVVTGTYSSIFIAAPVILSNVRQLKRLLLGEAIFIAVAAAIAAAFGF